MRRLFFILAIMLSIQLVAGAQISGKIYDLGLDLVRDTILEIDTEPKQTLVSKDGSYSFNVPLGKYTIIARKEDYYAEENISVKTEGNYTLDLIIWPSFEEEDELLANIEDIEWNQEELPLEQGISQTVMYVLALFAVLIMYILFAKKKRIRRMFRKVKKELVEDEGADKYINKILEILKEEHGRTTQKEIRKRIPLSEAKISLLLAELEHNKVITKFKKGRANIIVLKR